MPNLAERVAGGLGRAVGTFQREHDKARRGHRPAFLTDWAQHEKWGGGDYTAHNAQRRALQNSWVFTAIGMIAREVSAATFGVVRQTDVDNEPVAMPNHPLERLVRRPNPFIGRAFLWQYLTYWLELDGNAYWFVSCDQYGRAPLELWPLPSRDVEVRPGDAERFIDYYEYNPGGRIYQIPAEHVVHFRLPNPFDIFRGLSPLVAAMLPTDADNAMARWNGAFFGRDNVMPSAIINLSSGVPDQPIDLGDAERLKADLRTDYQAHKRKTAITRAHSVEVALLGWNPKDMDFIQGRQFTKEEIYAIYGVPAGLLDKNATEANAVTADRVFKEKTIWPLLCLIAEQMTAELAMPFYEADHEATFDDVRPANRQLELTEVSAAGPYLTVDEVRERYWQLPPLPSGRGTEVAGAAAASGGDLSALFSAPATTEAVRADLRRWRDKAIKAVKAGKKSVDVPFESDVIPEDLQERIHDALYPLAGWSTEEVKMVFDNFLAHLDEILVASEVAAPVLFRAGKATANIGNDDPLAWRKRREMRELQRALLQYFSDLRKRVVEAVQNAPAAAT